ncbi:SDR family oxidoreductase [Streptomyces sp. NPDC059679]|uniref:SDR family oxidoreductase n=1 Tax=Streptomyces sp. NPDC059679 TaxID=3346903 RepID=UPI0036BB386F
MSGKIFVTGASGQLGTAAIDHLLTKAAPGQVVALVRDPAKATALKEKGAEIRVASYDDTDALRAALHDVAKVLLVSSNDHGRLFEQHVNVIDAAQRAGVGHLVYTGTAVKDADTSPMGPMLLAHFRTEDHLKNSGLGYTILRNTMYLDVLPVFSGPALLDHGIHLPAGDGKVPFALRREMGEAAANVLLKDRPTNATYHLTAPESVTFKDIADALSRQTGKTVPFTSPDPCAFEDSLRAAGVPEPGVNVLSAFVTDMREGRYDIVTPDLATLLGHTPATLTDGLNEVLGL